MVKISLYFIYTKPGMRWKMKKKYLIHKYFILWINWQDKKLGEMSENILGKIFMMKIIMLLN